MSFYHPLRGNRAGERLDGLIRVPARLLGLCRLHLLSVRPARLEVALHLAAGRAQHRKAATVLAISLLVLDYMLVSPQVYGAYFFGKITIALYWFLQIAFLAGSRVAYRHFRYMRTQQSRARRAFAADAGARPRGGCRGAAARDRKRRGQPRASGRHSVAVDGRSRPVDARHPGGRRPRRSRAGRARQRGARHAHHAADLHAVRAGRRGRAGNDADAGAPPWAADQPPAGARSKAARRVQLSPVAVEDLLLRPTRDDRLPPAGTVRARQVDRRHRRRRLDRRGNLRPRGHVRRRAAARGRAFRGRAAHRARDACAPRRHDGRDRRPHCGRARPRAHHARVRRFQARDRLPRGRAQARAAAGARLGRGDQDQRVRLGQRGRCRRGGRRRRAW